MAQSYRNLFRIPTITENIALFRSLLDSYEIMPGEALALLGSIHAKLRRGKGQDGSAYARYAQTMALLHHHMPDVHQHVVANWQLPQTDTAASAKTSTKSYSDSLFDDTIAMQVPGHRPAYEANREQVKDESEILEVNDDEQESGEAGEGGEEESEEEDEPAEIEEPEIEEEEIKEESEEWDMGENEVEENRAEEEPEFEDEEPETEELVYEDISEAESYDGSEMGTKYEIEPMEEEDPPWVED